MSHDEISQIKHLITELDEKMVQQRSAYHSDTLKEMYTIRDVLTHKIEENTQITKELREHPIFKAWNDGKTIVKFMKWGGIVLIGLSTFLVAIKNGGATIREYLKLALGI